MRSVTFLQTDGNVAASVAAAVHRLDRTRKQKLSGKAGVAAALVLMVAGLAFRSVSGAPPS